MYADEDAAWWSARLDREIPPGLFGENLRTTGLPVTGARVGEQWRVGNDVVLEVRRFRTPCENLALRMGIDGFHLEFLRSGRVGAMCRVLSEGEVRAGDPVRRLVRPSHQVTIGRLARGFGDTGPDAGAARQRGAARVRACAPRRPGSRPPADVGRDV